jgi:predicted amidohydrolase YtcJ
VTRTSSSGTPVGISQKISIEEALYIYTQGSAEIELQQENKGKIAPGFLADFIVVNQNPLTSDPFRLSEIAVESTWVGGQRRWEDNGI